MNKNGDTQLTDQDAAGVEDAPEQIRVRADKRARLFDEGMDPYPAELPITSSIEQVREKYPDLEPGEETDDVVALAGRVVLSRVAGKLIFATLQAGSGEQLQVMFSAREAGEEALDSYKSDVDLGDIIFVQGRVIASKRGELSILASPQGDGPAWMFAAKSLRPVPKVFDTADGGGVELSEDSRVRRRYLDLLMRPAARDMVYKRAAVVRALRDYLHEHDFVEVETPMLQTVAGGAAARPFQTHINAYDSELFLRIAPELFLKRAVVGGIDRVFEINRNFRNEGADSSHNPEFTMVEVYEAYGTYDTMATLTREMIQRAARDAFGSEQVELANGEVYDLSGQWDEITLYGSLSEAVGETVDPQTSRDRLLELADRYDLGVADHYTNGKIAEKLFEHLVGDHLYAPTFVRDFPADTSPLTREHREKEGVVEKWDLYVRGFELATAYSELTDPVVQRERFEQQALVAAKGDPEAMELDEDFLEAMDYGMPPAGGMGLGLDRLLMALTGLGIRETILFPLVMRGR